MEVKLSSGSIYYEIIGDGIPVLTIHGFMVDHRLMKGCLEPIFKENHETERQKKLHQHGEFYKRDQNMHNQNFSRKQKYKRIYFDLPGMGKTKAHPHIKNSDDMLKLVMEFIDAVIHENFILIGESYGCLLARGLIHKKIKMIKGLLLLCPVIHTDMKKRTLPEHEVLEVDEAFIKTLGKTDVKELSKSFTVVQNERIWKRYVDEILKAFKIADKKYLNAFKEEGYPFSYDVDTLEEIYDRPALILCGRQDAIVGYKDAASILDNYHRASYVVLDKAGHNLQIEQDILFTQLVSEWLERVEDSCE